MREKRKRWRPATAGALVLAAALATSAGATTITVDATVDAVANDGNCTLREAILAANGDTGVDACAAGSGADVVVVPAGTYALTGTTTEDAGEDAGLTGDLDITDDLELEGAGAGTVISGPKACLPIGLGGCIPVVIDRVLDIDPTGAGISVRVSQVILGDVLGGYNISVGEGLVVLNRGSLAIADSSLSGFSPAGGSGVFSEGPLRIERSVLRGPGTPEGSVRALDTLDVMESTIDGGISSAGPLRIERSVISDSVHGIVADGDATILNSTISGNMRGGIVAGGTLELSNVTVTENSGTGVAADVLVLRNSIVAGNSADCLVNSTVGDAYNIDGDSSCGLSGTDQSGVPPRLGPLADNGGPTLTHALLEGSPAIDMGSPDVPGGSGTACGATDQRGVARPVGARCDVGAFEGTDATTTIPTGCRLAPRLGCQPALAARSKLALRFGADDTANELLWSWVSSAAVPVGRFGDPATGATGYTVCLYDQGGRWLEAIAPAGGTCGRRPCWEKTSLGFRYTDQLLGTDGLSKISLKKGVSAGRAKITVKGKGANLGLPNGIGTPVRVQLLRDDAPTCCWEATFSTTIWRGPFLKGRSDP